MIRSALAAALILAAGLTAGGCGTGNAGAAASRWNDGTVREDAAIQRNDDARGPLENGRYDAGADGRVAGRTGDGTGLEDAGRTLARGAKDAARSLGDMAEDALDGDKDGTGTPAR